MIPIPIPISPSPFSHDLILNLALIASIYLQNDA